MELKKTFICNDINIIDFDSEAIERYSFCKADLDPRDYQDFDPEFIEFSEWCEDNLSYDELYEIPMMNALYYFPSFISIENDEEISQSLSSCTILYDNELELWAVGMTGGGMDLTPQLADAFIKIGKGIPEKIAENLNASYSGGIGEELHKTNCLSVAKAFYFKALQDLSKIKDLGLNNITIERHIQGLKKVDQYDLFFK